LGVPHFFLFRVEDGKAAFVVFGELQQPLFDQGVRTVSERAHQFCLLAAKILIHLKRPNKKLAGFYAKYTGRRMVGITISQKIRRKCRARLLAIIIAPTSTGATILPQAPSMDAP
jgi:hypothetical protein